MDTVEWIAQEWIDLFNLNTKNPTKNIQFKKRHDAVDSKYRKLSLEDQSKFTKLINAEVRKILAPTSF